MTETIILRRHRISAGLTSAYREDRIDEERRPRWLTCTYERFLVHLVIKHGPGYLQRPDGTPLEPRRP